MTDTLRTGLAAPFGPRTVSRAAFGCLLGAALLAPGTPARAGDNDDSVPIDTKIIRGILEGIGLRRDGSEGISYGERAPLVIPPTHTLPPPENSGAALANNPAWPVDPDVKRRKEEAALERKSTLNAEQQLLHDQSVLRPDELTPGPKPRKPLRQSAGGSYESSPSGYGNPLPPDKLGSKGNIFSRMFGPDKDENVGSFTGEPPRTALTEPPQGYQTPSPEQPYGVGKTTAAPKATNYPESHGTVDGKSTN
jgi:hypothetical protein